MSMYQYTMVHVRCYTSKYSKDSSKYVDVPMRRLLSQHSKQLPVHHTTLVRRLQQRLDVPCDGVLVVPPYLRRVAAAAVHFFVRLSPEFVFPRPPQLGPLPAVPLTPFPSLPSLPPLLSLSPLSSPTSPTLPFPEQRGNGRPAAADAIGGRPTAAETTKAADTTCWARRGEGGDDAQIRVRRYEGRQRLLDR